MKGKLKTFFLKHGEKLGFGLFVVFGLLSLGMTRWTPYEKTPQELLVKANEADSLIDRSVWPESAQQELRDWPDVVKRGREMMEGIPSEETFYYTTEMFVPAYKRSEPILQPKFFTVEELIAGSGQVVIEVPAPSDIDESADDSASPEVASTDKSDVANPFARRKPKPSSGTGGLDAALGAPEEIAAPGGGDLASLMGAAYDPSGMGLGMGTTAVKKEIHGKGYQFASVRGYIDWNAQKANYIKSLHLPPDQAARAEPVIIGFEVQRQRAESVESPWTSEWATLDIENSLSVLEEAIDIEADTVDVSVTDPAITEPLPRRAFGFWAEHATHPKIANFELSPEEVAKEQLRQEKIIEAHEAAMKAAGGPKPAEKKGFAGFVVDTRGMQNDLSSGMYASTVTEYESNYMEEMNSTFGAGTGGTSSAPSGGLLGKRSAASGRFMLFRFFDFDVEPGQVYRYRVRIEYANPNFAKPIELLADATFADGQTRKSDWSEPTSPVSVNKTAESFLTNVKYENKLRSVAAELSLFHWNRDTGTFVTESVHAQPGDPLAVESKAKLLNPLTETYETPETAVNVFTGQYLVDMLDGNRLNAEGQLPGIGQLPQGALVDQALVLNEAGNLELLNTVTQDKARRDLAQIVVYQNQQGKKYEEEAKEAASITDSLLGGAEGMGMGADSGYNGAGSRPPSSSSKKRRGGGSSSSSGSR